MEKESIIILFIFVLLKLNTNLTGYFDISGKKIIYA